VGTASTFRRLLTHPETGVVLSVGRDRYAVPEDLRRWLQLRDGRCRFPGCNQPPTRCDLDHTAWAHGGTTSHHNLAHLCPKHHKMKHETARTVTGHANGTLTWTAPTGQEYITSPPFHRPVIEASR